jgi:hypothetical protein
MGANTIPPNTHNNNTSSVHPNNNSSSDIIDKKLKDGKIERMWTQNTVKLSQITKQTCQSGEEITRKQQSTLKDIKTSIYAPYNRSDTSAKRLRS